MPENDDFSAEFTAKSGTEDSLKPLKAKIKRQAQGGFWLCRKAMRKMYGQLYYKHPEKEDIYRNIYRFAGRKAERP